MFRQYLVVSLKIIAAVFGAAALTAGCKDDVAPTAKVTFDSSISNGTHKSTECGKTGLWFTIGSFGTPAAGRVDPNDPESPLKDPVRPIEDGAEDQQGSVALSCSVVGAGEGFNVRASAQLTGATGGSFTVIGFFKPGGEQQNITLSMTKKGETFSQTTCKATFDSAVGQAVASGRLWAVITCPDAEYASAQQICATRAEVRLENCTQ